MDLPPHGWDREGEARGDEYDDDDGEEEECSEQRGKGCSVVSRFPGEAAWPPGGCSHCAASCKKHGNKGMRQRDTHRSCFQNKTKKRSLEYKLIRMSMTIWLIGRK